MIAGEARKGPLAFAMDLIYRDLGDVESKVKTVQGALHPLQPRIQRRFR